VRVDRKDERQLLRKDLDTEDDGVVFSENLYNDDDDDKLPHPRDVLTMEYHEPRSVRVQTFLTGRMSERSLTTHSAHNRSFCSHSATLINHC